MGSLSTAEAAGVRVIVAREERNDTGRGGESATGSAG
jgi:hypothetical protein